MIENEDSVVTSLNELRKLKHERITRQSHSRPHVGANRAVALAEDPAADKLTPRYRHWILPETLQTGCRLLFFLVERFIRRKP